MGSVIQDLKIKGFHIFDNIFSQEEVQDLKIKFDKCEAEVHRICRENEPDPYDFVQLFEKETIIKMQSYCNSSIIETAKGRYDVRLQMVKDEFKDIPNNKVIADLMKSCLNRRYLCDIGILVTNSHSNDGPWHRYNQLQNYYLNTYVHK